MSVVRSIPTNFLVILAAAFAALQVVLGAASLDESSRPELSVSAMAVYAALMALVLLRGRGPLGPAAAWSGVAGTAAITALVEPGLPQAVWPGYAAWHPAALQCLLIILAVRGRPLLAAAGCAAFAAMTVLWSLGTEPGLGEGVRIALAPVLFVATAVALARFLGLNDRRAEAKTRQALALLDEAARIHAHTVEAAGWVREVSSLASPSLTLAADPEAELSEDARNRMLETEAALRDRVRGGYLATDDVLRRVSAARSHGVVVHLFDDRGAVIDDDELGALVAALDRLLPGLQGPGILTVRARPMGRVPAVTIVFAPDGPRESVYLEI
ncbi:hypothetical protein [Sinomonas notoginsengisoli]|uniref:hypothetical protein n=1 Tax=Sinomonas notoginsengisoli TaxID=1457311 RepID=UPI001F171778|nr:hypothetical protein [Sinomonas notoginsengisoli]